MNFIQKLSKLSNNIDIILSIINSISDQNYSFQLTTSASIPMFSISSIHHISMPIINIFAPNNDIILMIISKATLAQFNLIFSLHRHICLKSFLLFHRFWLLWIVKIRFNYGSEVKLIQAIYYFIVTDAPTEYVHFVFIFICNQIYCD